MTAEGEAAPRAPRGGACHPPAPPQVATGHTLGGPPCPRLAHALAALRSRQHPAPARMSHQPPALRGARSGRWARPPGPSRPSPARSPPRPPAWAWARTPAPGAPGPLALGATTAMRAGASRRRCFPPRPGHRAHRPPPASRPGTPRTSPSVALQPSGRRAPSRARWASDRGGAPGSRTRRAPTVRAPPGAHDVLGADALGIGPGGAAPPGDHHASREYPRTSRSRRRRPGLSLAGQGEATSAPAAGKATERHPGPQRAGPRPAASTRSTPAPPRPSCASGRGGCCP
jgi:hypothetical protein